VTGLRKEDIQTHHKVNNDRQRRSSSYSTNSNSSSDQQERVFEQSGLGSKALSALIFYPSLSSEIISLEWLANIVQPEINLLVEVAKFFTENPNSTAAELLTTLSSDSASFIGTLLSTTAPLEEKNSLLYFKDCLSLIKKNNPEVRIPELKLILDKGELTEDEAFELQQHLLLHLESLQDDDKILLKNLSKKQSNSKLQ
jgi:hypothetical protein